MGHTYSGSLPVGSGGSGTDIGRAITIAGETFAGDFPVLNATMGQKPGSNTMNTAFITRLVKQGSSYQIGFSTYLGGNGSTWAIGVAMNSAGQVFVAGGTGAANLPMAAAWQSQLGSGVCFGSTSRNCYDAFMAQCAATNSMPVSTYWGGTDDDVAEGVVLDSSGNLIVVGSTKSLAFPVTAGSFQPNDAGQRGTCDEVNHRSDQPTTARFAKQGLFADGSPIVIGSPIVKNAPGTIKRTWRIRGTGCDGSCCSNRKLPSQYLR